MQTRALTAGLPHLSLARPIGLAEGIGDQILSAICYLPTLVARSVRCADGFDRAACSLVFVLAAMTDTKQRARGRDVPITFSWGWRGSWTVPTNASIVTFAGDLGGPRNHLGLA